MKSCKEIQVICSKSQYREATLWEKLQFRMHLLVCKTCAQFTLRNSQLTKLLTKAPLYKLEDEEKDELKKRLRGKM